MSACQATGSDRVLEIHVLSNRADLLSGGDVLVEIVLSGGADASGLQVSLNGEDVSSTFALRPNGRVQGLMTELAVGESTLTAALVGSEATQILLTNYPIGGPIFAGPQVQPVAWNGKVYYSFRGGRWPIHKQVGPGSILGFTIPLSRGFVVARTSLNTVNSVVSAEAVMMLKEHIAETLGPIRYTFGSGGSGGAVSQHLIANAYPGLLDGIQPSASFPDSWGVVGEIYDCSLLVRYFDSTSPAMWDDVTQRNAVMDNANELPGTCAFIEGRGLSKAGDPTAGCWPDDPPPEWVYGALTNPEGTRCTEQDY